MDGLSPHRDLGLSQGDVHPVQVAPQLEAPERRVTQARETSSDSPEQRHHQRDSVELSREALELSQDAPQNPQQLAGQPALETRELSAALQELSADALVAEPASLFDGKLNPELPPLPFRSLQEGPDFRQPSQEGTGNTR